jgi:nicotinamide riboside kinase
LLTMSYGQLQAIDRGISQAKQGLLFIDTDLQVFKVWSEYKYGICAPEIIDNILLLKVDAYVLTDIDMPWEYDVLREHPEPALRSYFFEKYKSIVTNAQVPYCVVSGNKEARLQQAIAFVEELKLK